jgi:hypothetical protein
MATKPTGQRSLQISQEQLLRFVHAIIGGAAGREDDQNPLPPGPWDPVIRVALDRMRLFEPDPVPWNIFGEEVALNPQPIPPGHAFVMSVAHTVIRRAELFQEIADAASHDGAQQAIIIVGGYTRRFSDDWCPTGFKVRWPFPGPRPNWFPHELDAAGLLVMAAQFEQAARETFSADLRKHFGDTGARFAEAGMSKIQHL